MRPPYHSLPRSPVRPSILCGSNLLTVLSQCLLNFKVYSFSVRFKFNVIGSPLLRYDYGHNYVEIWSLRFSSRLFRLVYCHDEWPFRYLFPSFFLSSSHLLPFYDCLCFSPFSLLCLLLALISDTYLRAQWSEVCTLRTTRREKNNTFLAWIVHRMNEKLTVLFTHDHNFSSCIQIYSNLKFFYR